MSSYVTVGQNLPLSLDVQVNVSVAQVLQALNLSILCVTCENLGLLPDANRIRFYSDADSVGSDFGTTSEPYFAALAFFGQSPRPQQMAVAEVFLSAQSAILLAAPMSTSQITALRAVTNGNMSLNINGTNYDIEGMDFSGDTTLSQIQSTIQNALEGTGKYGISGTATGTFQAGETISQASSTATAVVDVPVPASGHGPLIVSSVTGVPDDHHTWTGESSDATFAPSTIPVAVSAVPATCSVVTLPGGTPQLAIKSTATGPITIANPVDSGVGTFVGDDLNFTSAAGANALPGYTPTNIASELTNVQNAAAASGQFLYGWCFGASLRVPAIQEVAASWALAQQYAFMPLVSNDPSAVNPVYTSDIGSMLKGTQNKRVMLQYHNNSQQYPDVSVLALMLSVNYRLKDSTLIPMFKALPGIDPVPMTMTQYNALIAKGYNVYVGMGYGTIDIERTGQVPASGWWMDTVINMDNFANELVVNVYNVFLRNGKVPYTSGGQLLLVDACMDTGYQYTYNGTFADRQVEDLTQKSGYSIVPAVQVNPTPIWMSTSAQRISRVGPPIGMVCQDAGAIQSISINVQLVE